MKRPRDAHRGKGQDRKSRDLAVRRVRLTDARVEALEPGAREYTLWADDPPRLGVRVLPSGAEGVVVWHGRPRSMKSLAAEAAMLSLALSESCALGNPRFAIKAPVGVLWLGEEDSERLDAFRFNLLLAGHGAQAPEAFRLVVRPGWDLESPGGQAELLTTIRDTSAAMRTPLRVLVIDPVRASMPSIDGGPKDAAKARAFLLTILRETSITVILLPHHDTEPRVDSKDERSRAERASGGVTFSMGDCMVALERLDERTCLAIPTAYKGRQRPLAVPHPLRLRQPAGPGLQGLHPGDRETTDEARASARSSSPT